MAEIGSKSLREPDEKIEMPGITGDLVEIGDLTVARLTQAPGWRWSTHVKPIVGGEWCQARHVGVILSGRVGVLLEDGKTFEFGPDDVYDIPPRHDGYVIGHEPVVALEWAGTRTFTGYRAGQRNRVLKTLLFTDIVGSTEIARKVGDSAWRDVLSTHFESVRAELERFGGHEIKTTGDGVVATFDGPALALRCADAIRRSARTSGVSVRAGVHVGEVEIVGNDVRGVAVHETERIMSQAKEGEILASETTRVLAIAAGLAFEDRGTVTLKGLPGEWRLAAFISDENRA